MVNIRKSISSDVFEIRHVTKQTWLTTYPNKRAGITKDDVESKFPADHTPEAEQKLEKKKRAYENPDFRTWVAEESSKIIGFCSAGKIDERQQILAMYVLPEFQGAGIGGSLIAEALGWLSLTTPVYVNVVDYNSPGINFYKKHGFRETGRKGTLDAAAIFPSGKTFTEIELVLFRNASVKKSAIQGKGVFASHNMLKGDTILIIDDSHVVTDESTLTKEQHEFDCDYLSDGKIILMQEPEKFINHSCEPTSYVKTTNGVRKVLAMRDIAENEEITFDYSINGDNNGTFECHCGAPNCRKIYQGNFFKLPINLQQKYLPYLDNWFVEENRVKIYELTR